MTRPLFLALCLLATPAHADTLSGAARVVDGDTIVVQGERIRLLDIDAPEGGQTCLHEGEEWPCGDAAEVTLRHLIGNDAPTTCVTTKRDRYKRWLAYCSIAGWDLSVWMAENGWAVPYRDCKCKAVRAAADRAKAARRGIWIGEFEMPWDWRKK